MIRLKVQVPLGLRVTLDRKAKRAVMRAAGNEVARQARILLKAGEGAGRTYWFNGRKYKASAPGAAPAKRSGQLAASIRVRVFRSGDGVALRDPVFYALFLEGGARGGRGSGKKGVKGQRNKRGAPTGGRLLAPRPFLSTALERSDTASLGDRVAEALASGIRLRKVGQ